MQLCETSVGASEISSELPRSRVRRLIRSTLSQRGTDLMMFLGGRAKNILAHNPLSVIYEYMYDASRYLRWSQVRSLLLSREQLRSEITALYHSIEKGLSYSRPKPGFGMQNLNRLALYLRIYRARYGEDDITVVAKNVLCSYVRFCEESGSIPQWMPPEMREIVSNERMLQTQEGGAKVVFRADIHEAALINFERFCRERYSVRHFAGTPVDNGLIEAAVRMAQKTPSVCNRQCWRVHVFSTNEAKRDILARQSGNRGFGHEAAQVLVVSSDLQPFTGSHERYQGWIDGGMFAMSLVYALHSLGIGTCCLNWSVKARTDKKLRRVANIPDNEIIIMMIAVGNLIDEFKVACSARRSTADILTWH